ncbi:MAG TPA: DUF1573 domain-containing protein [Flavitalea sp.]|nr:DUF1573 domain-containing protein [Flavitalea sp.]
MKKFLLLVFGLSAMMAGFAQSSLQQADESLHFKELSYNFGKIPQGRPVEHVFELVNKGKGLLLIRHVHATCGCTTPEWSQEPIAPGASSSIKVGFNAASEGHFSKTITISYNGNLTKTIEISGDVYKTPATSAPLNASLSLIKSN